MASNQKNVNVNFFQLAPNSAINAQIKQDTIDIINSMSKLSDGINKLERGDGNISLYDKVQIKGNLIMGTLINNQMYEVPPTFNEETRELTPLLLSDTQGLGYATCFLYDKETNILLIESVKNGIGPNAFTAILRHNFNLPSFSLAIVINPKDIEKFLNMTVINKFHVKISRVENGNIFDTKKKSLSQIIDAADDTGANTLEYKIQTGRKRKSLSIQKIKKWVKGFLDYKETEEVDTLTITGLDAEDNREAIDFIKQRLRDSYLIDKQRVVGDFTISKRYIELETIYLRHANALKRAYKVRV